MGLFIAQHRAWIIYTQMAKTTADSMGGRFMVRRKYLAKESAKKLFWTLEEVRSSDV